MEDYTMYTGKILCVRVTLVRVVKRPIRFVWYLRVKSMHHRQLHFWKL